MDFVKDDFDIKTLDVTEPVIYVHEALGVIYINEAFEEALEDGSSSQSREYGEVMAAHPDYVTRRRRIPITVDIMERYARLRRDDYMLDLIDRKREVLKEDDDTYEMSLFYSFKNMFLAKYPECRNVYKVIKRMDEYERTHPA